MAKILIRTPITSNGRDVVIDGNGQIRYKETIAEDAAMPIFEKLNAKLPPVLRAMITPYSDGDGSIEAPLISTGKLKVKK